MRKFAVEDYDIIVAKLDDDVAEVIVFKGESLFFRSKRPMRLVNFAKDNCNSVPLMEAFDQEEEFVRLDVKDIEARFFKKHISRE